LILSAAFFGTAHAAPQETILYRFGADDPGGMPLVMDSTGALYNVSYEFEENIGSIGTLFRLSPPAAPAKVWHFEALRRFSPQDPIEGVGVSYLAVVPNSTTLYGITATGGRCAPTSAETSCGTAFSLSPPVTGHKVWGFDSFFRFGKAAVTANMPDYIAVGSDGALYGDSLNGIGTTVHTYGTVFKLSPPDVSGGTWSNTVLYSFKGGADGGYGYLLPPDSTGTIYGQTFDGGISNGGECCGTFFELTPPSESGTEWTKTTLYTFMGREDGFGPDSVLISDSSGSYYGVTALGGGTSCFGRNGCGTIFRLSPPAAGETNWSETVLYRFRGGSDGSFPRGNLAIDQSGAIYGSTAVDQQGGSTLGTVWKLTPPSQGQTEWTKTVLHHFAGGADGLNPNTGVILDSNGTIYGIAEQGGSPELAGNGAGVIFKITQ